MSTPRLYAAALLALFAAAPAPAQSILVARAVGPNQWRLETAGGAAPMRNLRLAAGQKIILIDGKGTREIAGPGELMLLSKGVAKGVPTFSMVFRATIARPGPSMPAGVRGGPDAAPARTDWQELATDGE